MMSEPDSFNRPSLTDVAYKKLREGILRGQLEPGRKLVVNELVEEWNISNTPIKEALNRLVADELVVALPRRGMQVRKYTRREMEEIFELRGLLEINCCRHLAERIGAMPEVAGELDEILAQSRKTLDLNGGDDPFARLLDLDADFHAYIVEQCGNRTLIRNFTRLHAHTIAIGYAVSRNSSPARWHETQREHEEILQGVIDGSPDAAEEAIREHLDETCASLARFFRSGKSVRAVTDSGRIVANDA